MTVRVQREDFDPGEEIDRLSYGDGEGTIGAVASFVGYVRRTGPGPSAMTLEHYPGMTEKKLTAIENEALARWPLDGVTIVHRYGRLLAGERIVLVAVASSHREAAFEACEFLIDWLKTKAPFWKLEENGSGEHWVEAKTEDGTRADRW